jgi:hypothetical protein
MNYSTTGLFFRDKIVQTDPNSSAYVIAVVKNVTDEESEFGLATRDIRRLGSTELLQGLEKMNYDLIIGKVDNTPIAHMAFQEHQRERKDWEMFSAYVAPKYRGKGICFTLGTELINLGRIHSVDRIRFGKGTREEMQGLLRKFCRQQVPGVTLDYQTGWVQIHKT